MTYWLLGIALTALCGAWLFRRMLRADRARWARREEDRRLYDAVSGKVLVRGFGGFDFYPANPGIIPEDTVLIVSPHIFFPAIDFRMEPVMEPLFDLDQWRMQAEWSYSPVIRPGSAFKITGVT